MIAKRLFSTVPFRVAHKGVRVRIEPFVLRNEAKDQTNLLTVTPYPATFKLNTGFANEAMNGWTVSRLGYFLFKFQQLPPKEALESGKKPDPPFTFVLGTQDLNSLFELMPQRWIGHPLDNKTRREVVCMVTADRSFDASGQQINQNQCVMKIEQTPGLIFLDEEEDEEPTPFDWFYEIKYSQYSEEGDLIPGTERAVRAKPTEIMHLQELVKWALPSLHGWHAIENSSVVDVGTLNPFQ